MSMLYVKAKHGAIHERVCLLLSLEGARGWRRKDAVRWPTHVGGDHFRKFCVPYGQSPPRMNGTKWNVLWTLSTTPSLH